MDEATPSSLLPLCLSEPVAIIQGSHEDVLLPQVLPLLLSLSSSLRGLPLLLINLLLQWVRSTAAVAILISVGFRNQGHRKLHTLWLMSAAGRCQSVDNWTIVSYSSQGLQDQQSIAIQPPQIIINN